MRNDFESNYLAHHGILGMKWGRKNGPPYPLGASDHSAAEKKAGWRKSLGGGRNESLYDRKITRLERAAAASKRDADDLRKAGYKQEADAVQKVSDKNKAKADKVRQLKADNNGRMTKGQKVVVGVASAAALKSVIDTGRNVATANAMLDGFTKIPLTTAVGKGAVQAGKVAAVAALATYGGVKLYKYMKSPEREQKKFDKIKEKTKKLSDKEESSTGSKKNDKVKSVTSKKQSPSKTAVWNKSSSYNAGFLNYIKEAVVKPEMVDDPELLDLLVWEYEEATGKKAMKS